MDTPRTSTATRRIPIWIKIVYSAFVAVLVPYYWVAYTPWNFLYFCDIALLTTLVALWTESPFLASMPAVGILLPQAIWVVDMLAKMIGGVYLTGMTKYMFDANIPVFVRGLSSFHGWLPFLLVGLVWRLGYDHRALKAQALLAVALLAFCYVAGPTYQAAHPALACNINYVFGMDDKHPQTIMAPALWVAMLMALLVVVFYIPTHLALRRWAPAAERVSR